MAAGEDCFPKLVLSKYFNLSNKCSGDLREEPSYDRRVAENPVTRVGELQE